MNTKRLYSRWKDALVGRRKPMLVPTRILHAQAFSPFGQFLSEESVTKAWEAMSGTRPMPAWMLLGQSDTPTGTRWRLAFTPPLESSAKLLARPAELILPEATLVHRAMAQHSQSGWSRRQIRTSDGIWVGLWLQDTCERLVKVPDDATLPAEIAWQEQHWPESLAANLQELLLPEATASLCEQLVQASPESSLLPMEQELARTAKALRRRNVAILTTALVALGTLTAALALASLSIHLKLAAMQTRTARIQPTLERIERLTAQRQATLASLEANPQLLRTNPDLSRWLRTLARNLGSGTRAQALTLQALDAKRYQASIELSVADWSDLESLLLNLRKIPHLQSVRLDQQTRKEGRVHCIAKLEGTWP